MRILSITAGAAGMYCGSCLRDNALAAELLRQGHEVTLVPVYTPTRTDEPNVSDQHVLFGGISVYLQQRLKLFRHLPGALDRIWDSPAVINAVTGLAVSEDPKMLGDLTISMLQGEKGVLQKEFSKVIQWLRTQPVPDVVNLPNSLLIPLAEPIAKALNRPVCCTLQGEELFIEGLLDEYRGQALYLIRRQTRNVDRFIAVSEYCARFMCEYLSIPSEKMSIVPLGINTSEFVHNERGATRDGTFRVGFLARIAPEKGLRLLAKAYAIFRGRTGPAEIRLEAAGYLAARDREHLRQVQQDLATAGLGQEFTYHGVLERQEKLAFLRSLDFFSVPATFDEPKGIYVLEAMASGLPVAQPNRGAFPEIIAKTGGGLLVNADDPEALADALFRLWQDRRLVAELGKSARDGVAMHYTIQQSAAQLLKTYEEVIR